jgi:hypothetical protein
VIKMICFGCVLMLMTVAGAGAQTAHLEGQAVLEFQRAADAYAFAHRQIERRGTPAPLRAEGAFFTPVVAAVFRSRIRTAMTRPGCGVADAGRAGSEVPRVNTTTVGTHTLPACVAAVLPALPEELEYRMAGIVLLLADAHLDVVVDVLHAAFPRP